MTSAAGGSAVASARPADRIAAHGLAVATRGLTKRYGARPALNGLDLSVPRSIVYGFLGPNGAGKTTTLRLLVGLLRPNAGTIELLGRPFSWRDRRRLFEVGSLIEVPAFYPYLSGRDNLRAIAATGPPVERGRIDEVLEFVALGDRAADRYDTYSLGMKQRLGIAAALLNDPPLLLLDEPANGLDPAGIVAMRALLRLLTSRGTTVLLSSHILPEVEQLADVVGIIAAGRLVREGRLDQLLAEGAAVRVRVATDEGSRAAEVLAAVPGSAGLEGPTQGPEGTTLTVRVAPDRSGEVNRRLATAGIYASRVEATSDLESLFLSLTGRPDEREIAAVAPFGGAGTPP
ncbi:MAG TPA: ATP-binding cassette domain-containing protein [Candidatus Limnocylindrales bacterium]|nr:ATP-binding cassette domain-containing protein [Candidatus Limnocylindrales bacterium]